MKKLLIVLLAVALPALLHAQTSKVEKLFKKYSGSDGYTAITISEYMFELFSSISDDDEDAAEFKEATSQLTGIRVLTIDSVQDLKRPHRFYNELTTTLSAPEYKELMLIQDGPDEIKFVIHEEGKKITELVMLGEDFMIVLLGDIDLKQISKLSEGMDIDGMEHLEKVEER